MNNTVTRDEVMANRLPRTWFATADGGAMFDVFAFTDAGVVVQSLRTKSLLRVVQTGTAWVRGKGRQVRVRFEVAEDTGDLAGTLSFEGTEHFGGVAPLEPFENWATR
jgi:hypothetical protein